MVQVIRTKEDAKEFLNSLTLNEEYGFVFEDVDLSQNGKTRLGISREEPDYFYSFSFGQGWTDQVSTILSEDEALALVWKHRKAINKSLKSEY